MYNSIVVGFLAKIWNVFVLSYEFSLLSKILGLLKRFIKFIFHGSVVKDFFIKDKPVLKNSIFYKLYASLVDWFDRLWGKINSAVNRGKEKSVFYNIFYSLFKDEYSFVESFSVFALFFGIGIFFINIFVGKLLVLSNFVAVAIMIATFVLLTIGEDIIGIFKESVIYRIINYLFEIEEGGNQWW